MTEVPAGFELIPKGLGFNDVMAPIYYRLTDHGPEFGFIVQEHHCNPMGMCHGGMLMTFMDFALAGMLSFRLGDYSGSPTINLAMDFISPGPKGEWLHVEFGHVQLNRTLGFASALIKAGDVVVARGNGTFKMPKKPGPQPL